MLNWLLLPADVFLNVAHRISRLTRPPEHVN